MNSAREVLDRIQQRALMLGVLGIVVCAAGFFADREQFFRSYLYAYLYWTGLAIGCGALLLLHNVVGGNWGVMIKRLLEAGTRNLPLTALFFVPILFGMRTLYIWARPEEVAHDANMQWKQGYLNVPFFIGRAAFYFGFWILLTSTLNKWSRQQDETGDPSIALRMRRLSAPALVFFVLTATFAFIDWIMSLEPHWYSTIYGAMFLVGEVLLTFAFTITVLVRLSGCKPFANVIESQHFHDLGNLMFAFVVLWTYLSFSQFLIMWSGNLPEEIPWYVHRFTGRWGGVAIFLALFHFVLPFLLLLFRSVKKRPAMLARVAVYMIFVRLVDVFWVVEPSFYPKGFALHWMDIAAPIGIGGLWVAAFAWNLKKAPLLPLHDPRLAGKPVEVEA